MVVIAVEEVSSLSVVEGDKTMDFLCRRPGAGGRDGEKTRW